MTEEDTFRRLKQIPFAEMQNKWISSEIGGQMVWRDTCESDIRKDIRNFFAQYGWGYVEFTMLWFNMDDELIKNERG